MNKILYLLLLLPALTFANLPPTTSKIDGDTSKKTTFDFEFPNFSGTHAGTKVSITGATNLPVSGDITMTGTQFNSVKVGEQMARAMATGVVDGSLLSINADPTKFNISAQVLTFSDYSSSLANPVVKAINCPSLSAISVTNLATADSTFVSVDPTCAIVQSTTFPTPVQRRTSAFVGRLSHINRTSVTVVSSLADYIVDINSQVYDLFDAIGAFNISGNVITPNGANLSFNRSAGSIFRRSANYPNNKQNPHVITFTGATASNFLRSTQNSTNPTPVNTIDVANYDVAGTVTAIPGVGGTSTNRRVYIFSTGGIIIQYGQVTYSSLANAIAGVTTESFVANPQLAEGGVLLAVISCRKDATSLNNSSQCKISPVGRFDQTGVTVGSLATTTLQQAYTNSATPQFTTSTALGSVDIKRGSAADTDSVLRIQNGAGTATATITGDGVITGSNLSGTNTGDLLTKSDSDASSVVTTELQTPNGQLTTTDTNKRRIETGNSNLLVNPSFEAGTYNSGWTCSLGSTTLETTAKTDGNKANAINSIGAGVRCYQTSTTNAANLKGLLGSAIVKIKTTDSIYKVCGLVDGNAAANERNCITVNPTSADLVFYPARTDFYMGGTSNGIVVYTTTTTSQPTVIDDAFVGVFNGGISQFSQNTSWAACTFSTLAWQGLGTVTNNIQCRRNGPNLEMRGAATLGTVTASQIQFPLPNNFGTILTTTSSTGDSYGFLTRANATTAILSSTIGTSGLSYFTASGPLINTSTSTATAVAGNGMFSTGDVVTFRNLIIPIAGWEANTNAAIAGCVDAFGCTNTYTATITTTTGSVTNPNVSSWITCTAANPTVCTFKTSLFTNVPSCSPVNTANGTYLPVVSSLTASGITVTTQNSQNGATAGSLSFSLTCTRSTTDFKPKTVVVSPLQEYVKTSNGGITKIISGRFGSGAGCMTACTTGNCTVCLQNGNDFSTISFIGAGSYRINGIDGTKFSCTGTGYSSTGPTVVYSSNTAQNSSYASIETINASSVNTNSYSVSFICHGSNL